MSPQREQEKAGTEPAFMVQSNAEAEFLAINVLLCLGFRKAD